MKRIIIGITLVVLLAILLLAAKLVQDVSTPINTSENISKNTQSNEPPSLETSGEYFSTQEDCRRETYSQCKCMLTDTDTENCKGWGPGI